MNFRNYERLLRENPWLRGHLGIPDLGKGSRGKHRLESWVDFRINHIAFRPFSSLDMNAGISTVSLQVGDGEAYENVALKVIFHIGGNDMPHSRIRYVSVKDDEHCPNEHTIRLVIAHLRKWHQACWGPSGNSPLILSYVVRETVRGFQGGKSITSFDIYEFPAEG